MKKTLRYIYRWSFWQISRAFCYLYLRPKFGFRLRTRGFVMPKRPFLIVANHGTFFDPWLVGHLVRHPLSIMMNEEGFRASKFTQWYLRSIGTYPKKKGESDVRAMRTTLQTLKDGYPVLIFPEGQTTWDGETQPIYGGIESIAKRIKLPLVMCRLNGNFLSRPWWGEAYRKGRVEAHLKMLTVDEIAALSKDELRAEIIAYLHNNDVKHPDNLAVPFAGPPCLQGLTRFVWICPACRAEDRLSVSDTEVFCEACQARWTMDTHFRFAPVGPTEATIGDLHDWSSMHKEQVRAWIDAAETNAVLTESRGAHQCTVTDTGEYPTLAVGTLRLTPERLTFSPDDGGEPLAFAVSDIKDYVFQRKTIFEFRAQGEVYKFHFETGSPMKWVYYFRYLNQWHEYEQRGWI